MNTINTMSTKSTERNALIDYITTLTPEQIKKLIDNIDLLKKVANMTDHQGEGSANQ